MRSIIIQITAYLYLTTFFSCYNVQKAKIIYNTGMKDYTSIIEDALSNSDHIIIKSGSYHLTAPIYLHNNVILEGEGEVILIKDTLYSHVFTNQSASKDFTIEWDSSITIKNLTINANKKGTQNDAVHPTANGNISFKFLKNLVLEDVKIINGDPNLYGVHLQSVKNARIKNYLYEGDKDGFHINGGCENIIIDGFDISSFDDAFGIMTDDYPRVQHNAQDIRKIIIKNGISRKRNPQAGFFLRLMTGSWKDWKLGNKYNIGHTINCKNQQYKKINDGELLSFVCPNHLNGDSLYSDGIIWRYIGNGTNKTSNIYYLSISGVKLEDNREIVRTINKDDYDHGEYPGTEYTSVVDSLYIEGYRFNAFRGKMGIWKTIPQKDYTSLGVCITAPILFIIIGFYYFKLRKTISKTTQ